MVAGLAQGATPTFRYNGSGDYNDILADTGVNGWPDGCSGPRRLPGPLDLVRFNWGNTVTLTNVAPPVLAFQMGVDESGTLVVASGGQFTAVGTLSCKVGNNGPSTVYGQLIIKTNGVVNVNAVLHVGGGATGILTIDGGTLNQSNHLWVGSAATGNGTVTVTNSGVLNILGVSGNGMLGLGTGNAAGPSGTTGIMKVSDGSVLNLYNIDGIGRSIQPGSFLDISGSGVVTFPGDKTAALTNYYTTTGKIIAFGGTGTVAVDYNTSNPGKTTLKAVGGYVPPTDCTWDPVANPLGHGFWNENENWTCHYRPVSITAVTFNKGGVCTVSNAALASYVVMGTNGPGGTLIITNGGILICGADNPSIIGSDSSALMVVESGGSAIFGNQLSIGLNPGSDGTLVMHGGTVSVAGLFTLGWQGGKGTAHISGGTLNLALWDYFYAIQGASVLDVTGTGVVVINGNQVDSVNGFISTGQITNSVGTNVVVDYNIINLGKTTIYPVGLYLPPAQAVWNPALNLSDTNGLWDASSNWSVGMCPGNTTIVTFNVPDAIPCTVTNAAIARYVAMGINGGPGGTLIITNGGSLITGSDNWTAVGYNSNALMIVENGGSASFGYHLWVGLDPGSDGTLIIDGGTVSVAGMFGLGWQGGKGTLIITNGGSLNLNQWSTSPGSIQGASVLNLTGTGTVSITGNYVASVSNYVASGKIAANGGPNAAYGFDFAANKTTVQVAPPRQSVTGVTASSGNRTLTCQATAGHMYHIESTPSLSPTAWTRVAGTTTNATGASVTFSLPASGGQMFYRTVSP